MENPSLVHYIPIGTTLIAAAFVVTLLVRASRRHWPPHLNWWAFGVFCYGLGTAFEGTITLFGNAPWLNTGWYWAGAILGGYPLATGSVYLLMNRKAANRLTAVSLVFLIALSVLVFLSPVDAGKLEPHRPSGAALGWQWIRPFTPLINTYAAVFLIGGAVYSSVRFLEHGSRWQRRIAVTLDALARLVPAISIADLLMPPSTIVWPMRALGTALIAFGALLPGIGGGMAKGGIVEALYIGEFTGLILIWVGYELCVRPPKITRVEAEPDGPAPASVSSPPT